MSWLFFGLDNIGLYNKRRKEAISIREADRLRREAGKVSGLEANLREAHSDAVRIGGKFDAYKRSSEEALEREKGARQHAERESDRLTRLVKRFSQATRPLFEALGIQAVPTEATDPNASSLPTLEDGLQPLLPYVKLLKDRDNREAVMTAVSVEEQRKMHVPYNGQDPLDYITNLVRNTNFDNEKSVLTSAELLARDLMTVRHTLDWPAWRLLKQVAANEGTARILKAVGKPLIDSIVEQKLADVHGEVSRDFYEATFDEHISPHISNAVKARVALVRISALEEPEYEQLPDVVLKAQGLIDPKEVKERLKGTFIKTLYAGNARILSALSSHSVLSNAIGEGYTLNDLLSEAANRVPLNVGDAKHRLSVYDNLKGVAETLGLEFTLDAKKAIARGYVLDILNVNDRARFDIAVNDPFIQTALTTDGITALIADYVRNQKVPASNDEARFSVGLLTDYEEILQRNLGSNTFTKVFGRHVKPFNLDQLFWLQAQPIYARNTPVKEVIDAQFEDRIVSYFRSREPLVRKENDLPKIIARVAQLPESSRKILLAGILHTERDAETRTHYVEKVLPHLGQQEAIAMFDGAIKKAYKDSKTEDIWGFRRSFSTPLSLIEERTLHFPTADSSALFTELLTAKEIPAVYAVWALTEIANVAKLRPYLSDETKAVVFGKRIGQIKQLAQQPGYSREKDELVELVNEHGHLFPVATVANLLDHYIQTETYSAREISKGLQALLDTAKVPRPELGSAIATAVRKVLYDSRREQPIPLIIYAHHAPVELLLRYRADIPSQDFSDLVNLTLRAGSLSRGSPEASYQVLKKFDESDIGSHVQPEVREKVYDIGLRVLHSRLPLPQERERDKFEYNRRMEDIRDFIESERKQLSTRQLQNVLGTYLTHEKFDFARELLASSKEDERSALGQTLTESFNAQRISALPVTTVRNFIDNLKEFLSPEIKQALQKANYKVDS